MSDTPVPCCVSAVRADRAAAVREPVMTPGEVLKRTREMNPSDAHMVAYEGVARCFTKTPNGPKYLMRLLASFDLVWEEAVRAERVSTIARIEELLRRLYAEAAPLSGLSGDDMGRLGELLPAIQDLQAIQDRLLHEEPVAATSSRDLALALLGVPPHARPGATVWYLTWGQDRTCEACGGCGDAGAVYMAQRRAGGGYVCPTCQGDGKTGLRAWLVKSYVVGVVETTLTTSSNSWRLVLYDRMTLQPEECYGSEADAREAARTKGPPS